MTFSGDEETFRVGVHAGVPQQGFPKFLEALSGLDGESDAVGRQGRAFGQEIGLVRDVHEHGVAPRPRANEFENLAVVLHAPRCVG